MFETVCFIVGRNLGDSVIQISAIQRLVRCDFAKKVIVWTRPQFKFLLSDLAHCQVVESQFPLGTIKQFGILEMVSFARAVQSIRRTDSLVTVDFFGDFRERMFAKLIGSARHLHIGWDRRHQFNRTIRNPFGRGRPLVSIEPESASFYEAVALMELALLREAGAKKEREPVERQDPRTDADVLVPTKIGIHPFASQSCRLWVDSSWRRLAKILMDRGCTVTAFGSPSERTRLIEIFGNPSEMLHLVTGDLTGFRRSLSNIDLLIGLDSFSIHMAKAEGVPSVAVFGASPPSLWLPPGAVAVSNSGGCKYYPCFNYPKCTGTDDQFVCIRKIEVDDVLASIDQLCRTMPSSQPEIHRN